MSEKNSNWGISNILSILSREKINVHFSGVGGSCMSSLFCLTRYFGISVSGSDRQESELLRSLSLHGADISIGSRKELPENTALLVYSLAISTDDRELLFARERKIPTVSRAEYMAALSTLYGYRIGVSGSHGKSTAVAMLHSIFKCASLEPTALSGAPLGREVGNFDIGSLDWFLYESCEYKDSFLAFSPDIALFLNLDYDHVDYFESIEALENSFFAAINKSKTAIINTDDKRLRSLYDKAHGKRISVGSTGIEDYSFSVISASEKNPSFILSKDGTPLGEITLALLGKFNILNAAMAAACALECGISFSSVKCALESFRTVSRRLERVGAYNGAPVYFDYAHHPTEIKAGIEAIRGAVCDKVCLIFSPHTYSRTERLFCDFVSALSLADTVLITEITAAREANGKVSSKELAEAVSGSVIKNERELFEKLPPNYGAYIVMGAGECDWVKNALIKQK